MINYTLELSSLKKFFGRRLIFSNLTYKMNKPGVYGVSGPNGSGKSTLVKIIAGINGTSEGKVIHQLNGIEITSEKIHDHIGFVAPYLVLYEEFSAWENLEHCAKIRGIKLNEERVKYLLEKFLLLNRKDDLVKTYSSGMKQRLKFIFALMHSPSLLILDEPTSNLDEEGKNSVYEIINEEGTKNIVLVASNENQDLSLCSGIIDLKNFKN